MCENKLKVKGSKCKSAVTKVNYLSHIVEYGTVVMDPEKICAVVDWPVPILVKQFKSFLGLINYYNRFIKGYSTIIAPLT